MKKIISIIGVLLAISLFAACSIEPPSVDTGSSTEGTLVLQIGGEERTLAPDELDELTYTVDIRNGNNIAYSGPFTSGDSFNLALNTSWTVRVEAFDAEGNLIASAQESVTLEAGRTRQLNLTLMPLYNTDIPGIFAFDIDFPDDISNTANLSLTANGQGNSGNMPNIDLLDEAEGSLLLPPGIYTMTLRIDSNRSVNGSVNSVYRQEVVYIYPGLTTSAIFTFTEADFTANIILSGSATVFTQNGSDINREYAPSKVFLYNSDNYDVVQTVDIEDGVWEIFIPSNWVSWNLNNVVLAFEAQHVDFPDRTVRSSYQSHGEWSNWESIWDNDGQWVGNFTVPNGYYNLDGVRGRNNINLTMRVTDNGLDLRTLDFPGTGGSITFGNGQPATNAHVAIGGWVDVEITPPTGYGLIFSSVQIRNINGSNLTAERELLADGTIRLRMVPDQDSYAQGYGIYADFFGGYTDGRQGWVRIVNTPGADVYTPINGYAISSIRIYEPGDEPRFIAEATMTSADSSGWREWTFVMPADYVWRNTNTMATARITATAAGQPEWVEERDFSIGTANSQWLESWNIAPFSSVPTWAVAVETVDGNPITAGIREVRVRWNRENWVGSNMGNEGYASYRVFHAPPGTAATTIGEFVAIGTAVGVDTPFYNHTFATELVTGTHGFGVAGVRHDGTVGPLNNFTTIQLNQPAPANFYMSPINGYPINGFSLYWDAIPSNVPKTTGYIIERNLSSSLNDYEEWYPGSGYWVQVWNGWETVTTITDRNTTNWTDDSLIVGDRVQYRIRTTTIPDFYNSDWVESGAYGVEINDVSVNDLDWNGIWTGWWNSQRVVYRYNTYGQNDIRIYLNNPTISGGSELLGVTAQVYNAITLQPIGTPFAASDEGTVRSVGNQPFIVVVYATNVANSGSFTLLTVDEPFVQLEPIYLNRNAINGNWINGAELTWDVPYSPGAEITFSEYVIERHYNSYTDGAQGWVEVATIADRTTTSWTDNAPLIYGEIEYRIRATTNSPSAQNSQWSYFTSISNWAAPNTGTVNTTYVPGIWTQGGRVVYRYNVSAGDIRVHLNNSTTGNYGLNAEAFVYNALTLELIGTAANLLDEGTTLNVGTNPFFVVVQGATYWDTGNFGLRVEFDVPVGSLPLGDFSVDNTVQQKGWSLSPQVREAMVDGDLTELWLFLDLNQIGDGIGGLQLILNNSNTGGYAIHQLITDWLSRGEMSVPLRFKLDDHPSLDDFIAGFSDGWAQMLLGYYSSNLNDLPLVAAYLVP